MEKIIKRIHVDCSCGCTMLEISQWQEEREVGEAYISQYIPSFYSLQRPGWNKFKDAVKIIWYIIRGKEYLLYDIALTEKWQIKEFKEAVAELDENIHWA